MTLEWCCLILLYLPLCLILAIVVLIIVYTSILSMLAWVEIVLETVFCDNSLFLFHMMKPWVDKHTVYEMYTLSFLVKQLLSGENTHVCVMYAYDNLQWAVHICNFCSQGIHLSAWDYVRRHLPEVPYCGIKHKIMWLGS